MKEQRQALDQKSSKLKKKWIFLAPLSKGQLRRWAVPLGGLRRFPDNGMKEYSEANQGSSSFSCQFHQGQPS